MVKKKVFWFQIAMHHAQLVNVFDATEDLGIHLAGFLLVQASVLYDVLEKLTT